MAKAKPEPTPPATLIPGPTSQFDRDVKRLKKQQKDMPKLWAMLRELCRRTPLDPSRRDHALVGNWQGYRECHVEGDWLLIYRVEGDKLTLARTGSHAELFKK